MFIRFTIAVILLAVVAGSIVGFNMFRDQAIEAFFDEMEPEPEAVDTVVAEAGDWTPSVSALGTINAARGIDLTLEAAGRIEEVTFEANDQVSEGDVLVQIDDAIERAELLAAVADVTLAESDLERARSLGDRGVAAQTRIEEAEAAVASARAQVQRIQATRDNKRLQAPFDGEIGIPGVEAGEYVSAGTPVATLQSTERVRVEFTVPEQRLRDISIGQTVELVGFDGAETPSGALSAIEPRIDPQSRLVSMRARLDNPDGTLRPGQFVRARVLLEPRDNVIALPQTAIVTSLFGDHVFAVVESEDGDDTHEARQVFVETGGRDGTRIEVTDGVAPGDRIVIAGQNRLSNGTPVTLDEGEAQEAVEAGAAP